MRIVRKFYNGQPVETIRFFTVLNTHYADVETVGLEPKRKVVKLDDLTDEPNFVVTEDKVDLPKATTVKFTKGKQNDTFVMGSDEYNKFVKDNQLQPMFIERALDGKIKQYKGYHIEYTKD